MKTTTKKTSTKLKIVGFVLLGIAITLVILGAVLRDASRANMPNFGLIFPGMFLLFISFASLLLGFSPNITRVNARLHSEAMDHAGEELSNSAIKTADVIGPAVTKVAAAVKQGMDADIYCKHCGKPIDADSKFCKHCAKEQ